MYSIRSATIKCVSACKVGVLNLFPVKYPRVITQSTRTTSKLTKSTRRQNQCLIGASAINSFVVHHYAVFTPVVCRCCVPARTSTFVSDALTPTFLLDISKSRSLFKEPLLWCCLWSPSKHVMKTSFFRHLGFWVSRQTGAMVAVKSYPWEAYSTAIRTWTSWWLCSYSVGSVIFFIRVLLNTSFLCGNYNIERMSFHH